VAGRDCLCPVVLTRGSDQMAVSTKFDMRDDDNVIRNYGRMLIELSSAIPDGIVSFFVSYSYMDKIISKWNEMGILQVSPSHHPVIRAASQAQHTAGKCGSAAPTSSYMHGSDSVEHMD